MADLNMGTAMSLAGQVALVTGGGTGIGLMIAKGFAANGARVYITGRREQVLKDAAASLDKNVPGVLIPMIMDVTNQKSIDEAVKTIDAAEGKLDVLVNNAGIASPSSADQDFAKKKMTTYFGGGDTLDHESFEGWAEMFAVNTSAPFFMTRAVETLLVKGSEARKLPSCVINVSSVAADVHSWTPLGSFAYSISKMAVSKMTTLLASEYARRKIPIRVNGLQPGIFPSEMAPEEQLTEGFVLPGCIAATPAKVAGSGRDMAVSATYLATAEYTNGVLLTVDGGLALVNP